MILIAVKNPFQNVLDLSGGFDTLDGLKAEHRE